MTTTKPSFNIVTLEKKDLIMKFLLKVLLSNLIIIISIAFPNEVECKTNSESLNNNNKSTNKILDSYLPKYVLGPGDVLSIKIYKFDTFNSTLTIMPDGYVNLTRIKPLSLNGLTLDMANQLITDEYKKILKNPIIYVDLQKARPIRVNINGEVQKPGIYTMNTSETNVISNTDGGESMIVQSKGWPSVFELIQKSGGLTSNADLRKIKLKRFNREKYNFEEIEINLWNQLNSNGFNRNYPIFDGDSVFVAKTLTLSQNEKLKISKSNFAPSTITVTVIGEVNNPGKATINTNSPIQNAILNAGGFTYKANKRKITLLRLQEDGKIKKVVFNNKNLQQFNDTDIFLKDRDVVFIDNNSLSKTTINLKSIFEPLSPLVNAASIYKLFFGE